VRLESGRSENPVPAELAEIDRERITTASLFGRAVVTVEVSRRRRGTATAGVSPSTANSNLDVRFLQKRGKRLLPDVGRHNPNKLSRV